MEQSTDNNLFALEFDHQAAAYLSQTAKWSRFLAIVWIVLSALMIVFAIFFGSVFSSLVSGGGSSPAETLMAGMGGLFTAIYLICAAIFIIPNIFRYQFASKTIQAIRNNDQALLNEALNKQRIYNKYWGIVNIIIISFYLLLFLIQLAARA